MQFERSCINQETTLWDRKYHNEATTTTNKQNVSTTTQIQQNINIDIEIIFDKEKLEHFKENIKLIVAN